MPDRRRVAAKAIIAAGAYLHPNFYVGDQDKKLWQIQSDAPITDMDANFLESWMWAKHPSLAAALSAPVETVGRPSLGLLAGKLPSSVGCPAVTQRGPLVRYLFGCAGGKFLRRSPQASPGAPPSPLGSSLRGTHGERAHRRD